MKTSKFFRTTLFFAAFQAVVFLSCTKRTEDVVNPSTNDCSNSAVQKGPLFTAVESIINNKCVSCHDGGQSPNLTTACNIVTNWSLIKNACVVIKNMPTSGPLPTAEQQAITSWVNAGHKYTD